MAKYEAYNARKDDLENRPNVFAPKRRIPEDDSIVAAFENELRQFIKRDELAVEHLSGRAPEAGALAMDGLRTQISATSNEAMESIDRVISDLQDVRHMLRRERERLEREISDYVNLSHTAQSAVRAIAESLATMKMIPGNYKRPAAE